MSSINQLEIEDTVPVSYHKNILALTAVIIVFVSISALSLTILAFSLEETEIPIVLKFTYSKIDVTECGVHITGKFVHQGNVSIWAEIYYSGGGVLFRKYDYDLIKTGKNTYNVSVHLNLPSNLDFCVETHFIRDGYDTNGGNRLFTTKTALFKNVSLNYNLERIMDKLSIYFRVNVTFNNFVGDKAYTLMAYFELKSGDYKKIIPGGGCSAYPFWFQNRTIILHNVRDNDYIENGKNYEYSVILKWCNRKDEICSYQSEKNYIY